MQLPYLSLTENGPANLDETISRAKFEDLTKDLLDSDTKCPFNDVIQELGVNVSDIAHVVLVGGFDPYASCVGARKAAHRWS